MLLRPAASPCNARRATTRRPMADCAEARADEVAHQSVAPVAAITVIGLERTATTETRAGPLTNGMNADALVNRPGVAGGSALS